MMFPKEMVILLSIAMSNGSDKTLVCRSKDVVDEYITNLYNSLVRRGYLCGSVTEGYKFTSKGNETFLMFLNKNRILAEEIVKALHQLGIESSNKIDELGREVIRIK